MADEFQVGGSGHSSSSSSWLWDGTSSRNIRNSSMDSSVSVSGSSIPHVFTPHDSSPSSSSASTTGGAAAAAAAAAAALLVDPNLQIMGLGLSSNQTMDWNLFRDEKAHDHHHQTSSNFHSMLQEDQSSSNFQENWRQKLFGPTEEDNSNNNLSATDFKQFNRALSLDQQQQQQQFSSHNNNQVADSNVLQGFLVSPDNNQQSINYNSYVPSSGYDHHHHHQFMTASNSSNWSTSNSKFNPAGHHFLTSSPPKQQQQPQPLAHGHGQLHFSNNTPFWNASAPAGSNDGRSSFFPSLRTHQQPAPTFDDKPKQITSEVRELGKKTNSEVSNKRPRNETTPSSMPAFKVRKEKMGDRITALQQLVSPFGKTDTASVLSETIEYIKFLHEQVNVLSNPYMKSGAHIQHHQQNPEKSIKDTEGPKQDLRSRGLCLVPVPNTFPVINEPNLDFWNPTFGGTYR